MQRAQSKNNVIWFSGSRSAQIEKLHKLQEHLVKEAFLEEATEVYFSVKIQGFLCELCMR